MGSSGKKKTTMAKLNRETRQRERRMEKDARKNARKQGDTDRPAHSDSTEPEETYFVERPLPQA